MLFLSYESTVGIDLHYHYCPRVSFSKLQYTAASMDLSYRQTLTSLWSAD